MDDNKTIEMIKATHDDGEAEINGRVYKFTKTVHKKRRSVFAFLSRVQGMMAVGDMSWLDWSDFEKIEQKMFDMILFDGIQLSKSSSHFEQYPEDYLTLVAIAMQVISYPLLRASN